MTFFLLKNVVTEWNQRNCVIAIYSLDWMFDWNGSAGLWRLFVCLIVCWLSLTDVVVSWNGLLKPNPPNLSKGVVKIAKSRLYCHAKWAGRPVDLNVRRFVLYATLLLSHSVGEQLVFVSITDWRILLFTGFIRINSYQRYPGVGFHIKTQHKQLQSQPVTYRPDGTERTKLSPLCYRYLFWHFILVLSKMQE